MEKYADSAHAISMKVNWIVERVCVFLMVLLVFDVWLGIMARYALPWELTFTEELARYLMIWMALLAISSGIAHRAHIGVEFVFTRFPRPMQRWLALMFDLIAFAFFAFIFVYGIDFVERGFGRFTMIFGVPKGYPYIGVPLAAGFACIQLALVAVRDFIHFSQSPAVGEEA